ncbi:TPA: hypothetical protein ACXLVJ_003638, partial [Legionella anisa]
MSLSTLNIDLLVEQITDKFIERSNYSTLRNSCILLSPISFVSSEIKEQLSRILQIDQQESTSDLTAAACNKQYQNDLDEQKFDLQESENDSLSAADLEFQLQLLREITRSSETELQRHQENIHRLQVRIKTIDELILVAHKKDEETHHHSHPEQVDPPSKTTHNHPHPETIEQHDDKHHTHSDVAPYLKTTHSHPNTTLHGHPETDLEREKNILTKELSSFQRGLKSEQSHHQALIENQNKINKQLLDLPEKAKRRQIRAAARYNRARARLAGDPTLSQLSEENYNLLKEAIEAKHKKLHQKQEQLMQRAIEISYQTYLTRLEIYLQSMPNLSYQENEALKQIIQFVREYLSIKAEEQKIRLARNNVFLEKKKIIEDKSQKEKKVERFKESNPRLASQNINLGKEDEQLEIAILERGNYRSTLLKLGLLFLFLTVGGAGTGVAVAGGILAVTPLFMAPAAVLAFITLSLFIAALVYTIMNSMDSNQLSKNKTTIKDNIATIAQQNGEMMSLENEILPGLANKISEAELNLSMLDKRIERLYQQAELKLNTAKQVTVRYPSSQIPFIGQAPQHTSQDVYQDSSIPSAPFMDDSLEGSTI